MYNGIGLQTPRGSGTNGYIQTNKFFVRPKTNKVIVDAKDNGGFEGLAGVSKKPNRDILDHDRKRQIELKLVILEDKLLEQGYSDAEIADKLDEARKTLEAASAAEEAGGPVAVIVDKKVSDTQSHQIAARKEKQMETLKAALGIGSEPDNQKKPFNALGLDIEEENDDEDKSQISNKNDAKQKKKETRDGKDENRKVVKDHKKEHGKDDLGNKKKGKRIVHQDSSDDSESTGKHVKQGTKKKKKKHHKGGGGSESDDDSDSDVERKRWRKKYKKNSRHDTDKSDSDPESESESESDSESDHLKGRKRRSSDHEDSHYDNARSRVSQKLKQHSKVSRRDSEDESDTNSSEEDEKFHSGRKTNHLGKKKEDLTSYDKRGINNDRRGKDRRGYDVESDSDSDRATRWNPEKVEKSGRRHDSDDDDSNTDYDRKTEKRRGSRRHDSDDDDSDDSRRISDSVIVDIEKKSTTKSFHKSRSDHGNDLSGRERKSGGDGSSLGGRDNATEMDDKRKGKRGEDSLDSLRKLEEIYHSRKNNMDDENREVMRNKRKIDDGNLAELPEAKSRSRNVDREVNRGSGLAKMDDKSSRSQKSKDDYLRSSRSAEWHDSGKYEAEGRSHNRHDESRRNGRDYEDRGEDRRQSKEEGQRVKKHKRDDEDELHRKDEKDGEYHRGRYGREREDRGSKWNERDRQVDSSKRARYDDSRSSERRYENDRHDDRRARH